VARIRCKRLRLATAELPENFAILRTSALRSFRKLNFRFPLEQPHVCAAGYVYVGQVVESKHDLDGEEVRYRRVPCRRCVEAS
jgi:hypothetical protein